MCVPGCAQQTSGIHRLQIHQPTGQGLEPAPGPTAAPIGVRKGILQPSPPPQPLQTLQAEMVAVGAAGVVTEEAVATLATRDQADLAGCRAGMETVVRVDQVGLGDRVEPMDQVHALAGSREENLRTSGCATCARCRISLLPMSARTAANGG